ncbi:hypothetical protein [Chryseobacterium sp. BIGb0232]|uniref:hypothetical protein n=1 Tax=Chryseobacterium sp. BIGb0232 TaxID=2940598 RepID=UPI000F4679BA|nr:hypothetical protein [Chryseobacterium sp. BIGb0232]MCS4302641.1 hypothetical protein [Chryseobacterium sp. BIGb0232]
MKINRIFTCISLILILFLFIDLAIFRINTMPKLTEINHEDFIKEANNIKDLDLAKTELKRWINNKYDMVERQNNLYMKYLYIGIILLLIEVIKLIFGKKRV